MVMSGSALSFTLDENVSVPLHVLKAQHAFVRVGDAVASTHWIEVTGAHGQAVLGTVRLCGAVQETRSSYQNGNTEKAHR